MGWANILPQLNYILDSNFEKSMRSPELDLTGDCGVMTQLGPDSGTDNYWVLMILLVLLSLSLSLSLSTNNTLCGYNYKHHHCPQLFNPLHLVSCLRCNYRH